MRPELTAVGQGVFAWLQDGGHGRSNAGVVIDADGVTVIDTLMLASQWKPFAAAVEAIGAPIPRCVLSSSHLEFVGGTPVFWRAAMYGRAMTSDHLDQPANPHLLRKLHPDFAGEISDDLATRPITHVVDEASYLSGAAMAVPTGGQQQENLMVLVPGADVLFAGAMCSFGTTPLAFDGHPAMWAEALADIEDMATTIVPGHGPIGDASDVAALREYLLAVVAAEGDPNAIGAGPWDAWHDRHYDAINVERAAMLAVGDPSPPPSLLRQLGVS